MDRTKRVDLQLRAMFKHFTVIPAIDLKGGQVVRLQRGDMTRATIYGNDPGSIARAFAQQGAELLHVVDLDGAIAGRPVNLAAVAEVRAAANCRIDVSGGLRSVESVREAIGAGADFVSIGSAAFLQPDLLDQACVEFPGHVFGSLDVRDGKLAVKGWVETSELSVAEAIERFQRAGVAALIVTDIARDGMESGLSIDFFQAIAQNSRVPVIASGGVGSLDDIHALCGLFTTGVAGVITGRALYEGRFTLAEAVAAANSK